MLTGIIFYFDETFGPDTISYVLSEQGIEIASFWKEINSMIDKVWDPPLVYMHVMKSISDKGELDLSVEKLSSLGKSSGFSQDFQMHS